MASTSIAKLDDAATPAPAASASETSGSISAASSTADTSASPLLNDADTTAATSVADSEAKDEHRDAEDPAGPESAKRKSKGKGKATEVEETVKILIDEPGHRKELRTSSTGRQYAIETRGMWTILRSLNPRAGSKLSVRERLKKRLKEFATFWPFLLRFATEVLQLGKWRFFVHLIGSTITGLVPALRIYLSSRLIAIAQTAADKRILRKSELISVASTAYLSLFLENWIDGLLLDNNGILRRRFESMVNEHLMQARARLDVRTLGKNRVMKDFVAAHSLVHALGDGSFVVGQIIDLFTSAVSLGTQASMLWGMSSSENADLALVSMFSASLMLLRWFWRRNGYSMSAVTDTNYNRMSLMEYMSHPVASTFGERKVLGLGNWVLGEYKKASNALGDVSLSPKVTIDPFATTTEAIRAFTDTAIYVLFALKVSQKPIGDATLSMSSLTFIQSAARGLAGGLYRFVRDVQNFGSEFSAFRAYYRVLEIKPVILDPVEPVQYKTVTRLIEEIPSDGSEASAPAADTDKSHADDTAKNIRSGMEIEFRNVSFTWPGKREKALDDISFHIKAGDLVAVVGFNGSGKSTVIALMARLVDPSSGQIFINGIDIRLYNTSDLHRYMSLLFQSSAELPLTIREFIGIGNVDDIDNMDKIRQAATESGAAEFVDKLKDGFESSFTGQVEMETAETMYKDAVKWDEEDEEDDEDGDSDSDSETGDEAGDVSEKDHLKLESSESNEGNQRGETKGDSDNGSSSDESENDDDKDGNLAFSGGQRQKLVMARSFMRQTDLAVFDEYSASLDPVAEHELFKRITVNRGKQTILYITHRYSTVRHADSILMLEKGKVIESGTHEQLLAIPDGKYAEMCRLALGEGEANVKDTTVVKLDDIAASQDDDELKTLACNTPLPSSPPLSATKSADRGINHEASLIPETEIVI